MFDPDNARATLNDVVATAEAQWRLDQYRRLVAAELRDLAAEVRLVAASLGRPDPRGVAVGELAVQSRLENVASRLEQLGAAESTAEPPGR